MDAGTGGTILWSLGTFGKNCLIASLPLTELAD